jgi:hypothetical protein
MADKPEQGDGNASDGVGSAKAPRKPRSAPTIDLPASAVSEMKDVAPEAAPNAPSAEAATGETTISGEPPGESPAPRAERRGASPVLAALIGLIAGAAGGFGAYQAGSLWQPKPASPPDAALVQRLDTLEKALAARPAAPASNGEAIAAAEKALREAQTRETALRAEISRLAAAVSAESEERKKALAALAAQPPGAPVAPADAGEIEALRKALAGLATRLDSGESQIGPLRKEIEAVSARFATLAGREAMGLANARLAASALLEDAAARGRPLAPSIELIKGLGVEPARIAALAPFAESGLPGADRLLAEFRAIKPAAAPPGAKPEAGLLERLRAGATSLVEVRRAGEITGTDDAATIARAEDALKRGDLDAALALVGRLGAARAADYASWRARAETAAKP